ncbi:MAG: ABC transporter ATP-binding protein [Anaerococcus prevotii]|nr:ABC transporter ATP-binding protein [Anaerococcus prevotii]
MRRYLKIEEKNLIVYLIISLIAAILIAGTAFIYLKITSYANNKNYDSLIRMALISIPYFIIEASFDYLSQKYISIITNNIKNNIREDILVKIQRESSYNIGEAYKVKLNEVMINDLEMSAVYIRNLVSLVLYVSMFLISLLSAIYIQFYLTLIMPILSLLPLMAPFINKKILANKKTREQEEKNNFLGIFNDYLGNILYLKLSNLDSYFKNKSIEASKNLNQASKNYEKSLRKTYAVSYGMGNILYTGTWIIGGIFVYYNRIDLPDLIAMTSLMITIAGPIQTIADVYSELVSSKKIFDKLMIFLEKDNYYPKDEGEEISTIDNVVMNKAIIKYCDSLVLGDLNYSFKKDYKYLIVGESGSGKSSILKLLLANFKYMGDFIRINGKALEDVNLYSYYSNISYIPQDTTIFTASLIDNISLFSQNTDRKKAEEVLDLVGLSDLISKRENGLDSIINKNDLSGGEKKRLDLARALYQDRDLIIIDEVDSGLDYENQNKISEIIKEIEGKILICVSHSTNSNFKSSFDKILEIENKKLVEL